jgi:aminopeptidase N
VCERVSGRNLGFFFDAWVFGENYPRYGVTWASTTAPGGVFATVRLVQETRTTNPAFFAMPVDLRLAAGTRDTTVTVFHTSSGQEFTFALPFAPDTVQVDPGGWILKDLLPASGPLPDRYSLSQNYPNPFNAGTAVQFGIPRRSEIRVEIFDLLGRPVALLADGRYEPGIHTVTWDGRDRSGGTLASGVYCCRLSAEGYSLTNRMILLK